MNRSRSKKGKNSQIPIFISKLVQMLENQTIFPTISWTSTADSFNIKNISKFTEEVLPIYFKHRNFSSFIRQLNMYGFRKIRHLDGQNIYMHDNFKEGGRHLLKNISRKAREEKDDLIATYKVPSSRNEVTPRDIAQIKIKQKNLQDMCKHFMLQNQKLMEENQNLIKRMEEESREKEKKLEEFLLLLLTQTNTKTINAEGSGMLSITNTQHQPDLQKNKQQSQSTSGQNNSNNQQKDELSRIKALLLQIYNSKKQQNTGNSSSTGEHYRHQNQEMREDQNEHNDVDNPQPKNEQSDSFMSINDFLNAEDYDEEMNLSASH